MKENKLLQVNIDKQIQDKLKTIGINQGRSVTELVREAIVKIILEYNAKNI
jgi:hypothetical protein